MFSFPSPLVTTFLAAILTVSLPNQAEAADLIDLSDKSGRTIQAKIIAVAGEEVEIEMANGRRFTLPISKFSLSSQALIKKSGGGGAAPDDSTPAPPTDFVDEPIFEFTDLEFKDKKLKHFRIRTIDTGNDPADRYAEKIYDAMEETMPGLTAIFEQQAFRAPGKEPNSRDFPEPDKRFRHDIYFVTESGDYQSLVTQYSVKFPEGKNRQNFINSKNSVGNFSDHDRRFTVIRKEPGRPADQLLAHMVGVQLVGARIEQRNLPFWLTMGSGYYSEHQMFKKCAVHYIDFNDYYESESGVGGDGGKMTKAEILSNSESWVKPLKTLCKKGTRVNLERLFAVTTAELTPNDAGYAMALFSFMNASPENTANFNKLLDLIKGGSTPSPQDMADTFGYATPEEFEEAWYAFTMSSRFK